MAQKASGEAMAELIGMGLHLWAQRSSGDLHGGEHDLSGGDGGLMGGEVSFFVDDGQFAEGVEVSEVGGGEAAVFFDPFLPRRGCRVREAEEQ